MESYYKTLNLNLKAFFDKESEDNVKEFVDEVEKSISKISWLNKTDIKKSIEDIKKELFSDEKLDEKNKIPVNDSKKQEDGFFAGFSSSFKEWIKNLNDMTKKGNQAFSKIESYIKNFATKTINAITNFVTEAIHEMKEMASWDLQNSLIFNQDAADMYMQTGLQGADAYGFNKALETQGFGSFDEFITALPFMNEQQLEYMKEIAEINAEQYEQDLEVAAEFQKFQVEYDKFRQELQKSIIDFFMDNKETIMKILQGIIDFLGLIFNVVDAILEIFSGPNERTSEERKQATADILGVSSSTLTNHNTTNNNSNVNINNTFNGVGKQDQSWLANTGQMTYQQIIEYLKGA